MRYPFILPVMLVLIYACGSAQSQPVVEQKIIQKIDTCFYEIIPAADMDVPGTPAWDTTITRTGTCQVQCLKMRSWGTETQYNMSGPGKNGTNSRSCHFTNRGWGIIDITGLPAGDYDFYLLACGNGGGFSVKIQ